MVTASEPEATEKPEQPVCDACRAYGCKVQLPGEFPGTYRLHPRSGAVSIIEKSGILCILHYRDMEKDIGKCAEALQRKIEARDFDFRSVWYPGDVEFSGELENADFTGAQIGGRADFRETTFGGRAYFFAVAFGGAAEFPGTTFSGAAVFFFSTFDDKANFNGAHFDGVADFKMTTFGGAADFSATQFGGWAGFSGATFSGKADFSGATFADEAVFVGLRKQRDKEKNPTDRKVQLELRGLTLSKPEKVRFEYMDMENVRLRGTDVRKVEFTNVDWPKKLRDEWEAKKDEYPLVEKLYRQLRQNYEDQRNYPDAGRFYYGEMEMRRKAKPWWGIPELAVGLFKPRSGFTRINEISEFLNSFLTGLYWLSSGYGQSRGQAALVTLNLFLLVMIAYMGAGLQLQSEYGNDPKQRIFKEEFSCSMPNFLKPGMVERAAVHTAQVLTFSRERTYSPVNLLGEILVVLQTILLPLQIALFVLAVRRSFRR